MRAPSRELLALMERCLIGSLLVGEVSLEDLGELSSADFGDVKSRGAFTAIAALAADGIGLQWPSSMDLVEVAMSDGNKSEAAWLYLAGAAADFVDKQTAAGYAGIIREASRRRSAAAGLRGIAR